MAISRDERQHLSFTKWLNNKGKGTIVASTGYGKTRVATNTITKLIKKTPGLQVLIVVPTETLQVQWNQILDNLGYSLNCNVQIINTVVKNNWACDFLVLDEVHRMAADTFKEVFNRVKYKLVMGLTATLERVDGKHEIVKKYCPIVDEVNIMEAISNGWVSEYKEYKVYIDVDLSDYIAYNKEFTEHFGFFNFDWNLAMSMCGPNGYKARIAYRDQLYTGDDKDRKSQVLKSIMIHSMGLMRTMQSRKAFINNHPKKLEIARKIINSRQGKKIITFSNSVKNAEALYATAPNKDNEYTYSARTSKKKSRITIEEFSEKEIGVLHTVQKANEGLDVPGLSVGIILGLDSSSIKAKQRRGRVIRKEDGKQAEVFNLIIRGTVEDKWFEESHKNDPIIAINEIGLEKILNGEEYKPDMSKPTQFTFRF